MQLSLHVGLQWLCGPAFDYMRSVDVRGTYTACMYACSYELEAKMSTKLS